VIGGDLGLDSKTPATPASAINSDLTANKALAYLAEQKQAGIELSFTAAVNHVLKESHA